MERPATALPDQGAALIALYNRSLPQIYGYLLRRCSDRTVAEELTSETYLAAASAVRRNTAPQLSIAWLIGIARHKLVDHWRSREQEQRLLTAVAGVATEIDDPWEAELDTLRAAAVLSNLRPQHRVALTLRYLDDLSVPEVANHLDRTVHATEALLVRARRAFRQSYEGSSDDD